MADANPLDAARFAFAKRQPRFVLTKITLVYLACSLLIGGVFIAAAWPWIAPLVTWYMAVLHAVASGVTPPDPPIASLAGVLPFYALAALLGILLYAAFEAACLRWLVRGQTGGPLGLSLGADTWRVLLTYLVWLGLAFLAFCVVGVFYFAINALGHAVPALSFLTVMIGALAPLAIIAGMIYFGVRMSPAAASSVSQQRFAFFSAWSATRGRFWELLGAFIIVFVAYFVISYVLQTIIQLPVQAQMMGLMTEMMQSGDTQALMQRMQELLLTPLVMGVLAVNVLVSTVLAMLLYVTWFGVNASVVAERQGAPSAESSAQAPAAPQQT
jgi:hypothetical protein